MLQYPSFILRAGGLLKLNEGPGLVLVEQGVTKRIFVVQLLLEFCRQGSITVHKELPGVVGHEIIELGIELNHVPIQLPAFGVGYTQGQLFLRIVGIESVHFTSGLKGWQYQVIAFSWFNEKKALVTAQVDFGLKGSGNRKAEVEMPMLVNGNYGQRGLCGYEGVYFEVKQEVDAGIGRCRPEKAHAVDRGVGSQACALQQH